MSEAEKLSDISIDKELDFATAQSTYKIITALVEQVDASSQLIAIMASVMGEDVTRRITETVAWANYLQARRSLEALSIEMTRFVTTVTKLTQEISSQQMPEE